MPLLTVDLLTSLTGLPVYPGQEEIFFSALPTLIYEEVSSDERAELFARIKRTLDARQFRIVGQDSDRSVWNSGWNEVASALLEAPTITIESLKPQYYRTGEPLRMAGSYIRPNTDYFEYYAGLAVRRQIMAHCFLGSRRLLELGCGTGLNLLLASELFPDVALAGTDWVQPSLDILARLGHSIGCSIDGCVLDFLSGHGWDAVRIDADTDVMTCHALEQLGDRSEATIDLIVQRRPRRCLHIEPIFDFYDPIDPFDAIAARYHRERGYLRGLYGHLRSLSASGRIRILAERRVRLGNLYHEAYSYLLWEPV